MNLNFSHAQRAFLIALCFSGPSIVFAQITVGGTPGWIVKNIRPGTEVRVDQLGTFLVNNLTIGETEKNLPKQASDHQPARRGRALSAHVELISRETGLVTSYDSGAVDLSPGKTHDASIFFTNVRELNSQLAAPLKPANFVIFRIGQKTIVGIGPKISPGFPDVCKDSTHAMRVSLISKDEKFTGASGTGKTMVVLCLTGER